MVCVVGDSVCERCCVLWVGVCCFVCWIVVVDCLVIVCLIVGVVVGCFAFVV